VARQRRLGRLVSSEDVDLEVPLPRTAGPSRPPRLLADRSFLWLVFGDAFAQLGRWAFFLAVLGDATFRLEASSSEVALIIGCFSLPLILVSPLYGAAADRRSAKWLLVATSVAAVPIPFIALASSSIGWLYLAAGLYGLAHAAETPCRGAMVPRLVPADRLVEANGTISAALSIQMVLGPAIAALLTGLGGPTAPYFVTVVAALLAGTSYLLMPDRRRKDPAPRSGVFSQVADGMREAWRSPSLKRMLLIDVSVWFLIGMLISLEPLYIKRDLGLDQAFLGILWSTYGAGELIGSLLLTRVRKGAGRELTFAARGLLLAAGGFLLYVSVPIAAVVLAANVLFGIGFPFFVGSAHALIQRLARFPGRVTAAFSMVGEVGPVATALLLAGAGRDIPVRPWLLGAGIVFTFVALSALRVSARLGATE
jgi:predicted MFS family arabinose efflux permease